MSKVSLHVYDITNSPDVKINERILQINKLTKDTLGIGGIFHGAVEVFGEEWSFGYCDRGSGVFSCTPKENPMYTFRETIEMGVTALSQQKVKELLKEMSQEWKGRSYDMLARNCNHFCDELCKRLGVGPTPVWVNRFAYAGDTALDLYEQTSDQLSQMRDNVYLASKSAYTYFFGPPADAQPGTSDAGAAKPGSAAAISGGSGGFEADSNGRTALPVFPVMQGEAEAARGGSGRL